MQIDYEQARNDSQKSITVIPLTKARQNHNMTSLRHISGQIPELLVDVLMLLTDN